HEAMLGRWARLKQWIDSHREDLQICGFVRDDLQRWLNSGRDAEQLLAGSRLERTKKVISTGFLSTEELAFVAASFEQVEARTFRPALRTGSEDLRVLSKTFLRAYPARWYTEIGDALSENPRLITQGQSLPPPKSGNDDDGSQPVDATASKKDEASPDEAKNL